MFPHFIPGIADKYLYKLHADRNACKVSIDPSRRGKFRVDTSLKLNN